MALNLRQRGEFWHARGTIYVNRKPIRVAEFSTKYRDRAEAERFLAEWERDQHLDALRRDAEVRDRQCKFQDTGASDVLPAWAVAVWRNSKGRAGKDGILFTLDERDMAVLVNRSAGRCEVSDIEFQTDRIGTSKKRPFAPSIDRRNNNLGYTLANCRLVCISVNLALADYGEDVLMKIAKAMRGKKGRFMRRKTNRESCPDGAQTVETRSDFVLACSDQNAESAGGNELPNPLIS